jgi:energy-coupling factor transporter ATP-binding protein EcfA2
LHEALVLIVQRQIRLALEDDPHRLHLHGALIGDVAEGHRRVLMLGASGAGKSTMAAQLVHLGIAYATDEMVAVDTDCRVEAVRKPLKLRQGAKAHYPYLESLVDPLLRGVTGDVPIAPDAGLWLDEGSTHLNDIVVLSRHDAGPGCLEPCLELQRLPAVTMTRRMAENAFDFSRFGVGRSLLNLARLAASVHCWELYYCDSQQAAPMLAGLAGHRRSKPGSRRSCPIAHLRPNESRYHLNRSCWLEMARSVRLTIRWLGCDWGMPDSSVDRYPPNT